MSRGVKEQRKGGSRGSARLVNTRNPARPTARAPSSPPPPSTQNPTCDPVPALSPPAVAYPCKHTIQPRTPSKAHSRVRTANGEKGEIDRQGGRKETEGASSAEAIEDIESLSGRLASATPRPQVSPTWVDPRKGECMPPTWLDRWAGIGSARGRRRSPVRRVAFTPRRGRRGPSHTVIAPAKHVLRLPLGHARGKQTATHPRVLSQLGSTSKPLAPPLWYGPSPVFGFGLVWSGGSSHGGGPVVGRGAEEGKGSIASVAGARAGSAQIARVAGPIPRSRIVAPSSARRPHLSAWPNGSSARYPARSGEAPSTGGGPCYLYIALRLSEPLGVK